MLLYGSGALIERVLRHGVVVVRQDNVIPLCHGNGLIGVLRDSLVLIQLFVTKTGILCRVFAHYPPQILPFRASVRHAKLPVSVSLGRDGIQHLPKIFFRCPVDGHDNGKQRAIVPLLPPLPLQLLCRGLGERIPLPIIIVIVKSLDLVDGFHQQCL